MPLATSRAARVGVVALALLAACTDAATGPLGGTGDTPPGGTGGGTPGATAYVVRGRVVNAQGAPIAGAEVVADNQLLYNSNIVGVSDASGGYRLQLPAIAVTWAMSATVTKQYDGVTYRVSMAVDDENPFAGNAGAVRNFTWRTRGQRPDGYWYGSPVVAYQVPGEYDIELADVELTLQPSGPIIDGSAGETIVGRLRSTGDGMAVVDVPIGRYRITAREVPPTGPARALQVRVHDGGGAFAASTTSGFPLWYGAPILSIDVRR